MYDKKYYEMAVEAKDAYIKVASEMGGMLCYSIP